MKLYEYEGRRLFELYDIPQARSGVASTPSEAKAVAEKLSPPYVVKAQVLVGGRGKAGGIKFAETPEQVELVAKKILGMKIKGITVKKVLIVERVDIARELYLGYILNRSLRTIDLLASSIGGIDIEAVAREKPRALIKISIDPILGLQNFMVRRVFKHLNLDSSVFDDFKAIASSLYSLFVEYDCELAEINPLALTADNKMVAVDSKVIIDDNSLFRHPDMLQLKSKRLAELSEIERKAKLLGLSYVKLNGNIGIIGNGAGLTMATMDLVSFYGGAPANFLDIGGGARRERVENALSLILEDPQVKVVLINILGGITKCDEVALGIVSALEKHGNKPVVVRMMGTREDEGKAILESRGIKVLDSMDEAARVAVNLSKG